MGFSLPVGPTHESGVEVPSWLQLQELIDPRIGGDDPINGPTNAQATLRLFGRPESEVRVTVYRDHHAWCPYCQKVWLWLEEQRIPYRIRKVTMFCYGEKERWFKQLVPSGMLPALELDGRMITESDRILEALEAAFGPFGAAMGDPAVLPLRQLERLLFRAWCQWLCSPSRSAAEEDSGRKQFQRFASAMEQALVATPGPFLLGPGLSTADLVFVPYVERMAASLAYYKGFGLRQEHPGIGAWFAALEQRSTYLGTQSDFHTHAHDLPPQMGGCYASGSQAQAAMAARIDQGPWPIGTPVGSAVGSPDGSDPETSQVEPPDAALIALARVLKHRQPILERNPLGPERFDPALRCALAALVPGDHQPQTPPPGSAPGLRYLRDRISVPRDMPLHSARRLRQALEATARLDPQACPPDGLASQGPPIPTSHRRDQDPRPFLEALPRL
ncbi:MAG: glutathione S-transferase family protein [Cyanobium sp. LacPavin_0920_WC12_MAG_62_9]|nr:glutathione S-transferase family protein [Cyanobium sp. LacPavin_0920_WC12_MAG_62_9]